MKNIFKYILLLLAVVTGMGSLASCSDDDNTMSRLFRPIISSDNIKTGLDADTVPYATIKWDSYASADKYQLVLIPANGGDSIVAECDSAYYRFNNLSYDTEYNLKVKAISTTQGIESKYYVTSFTTSDFPTALKSLSSSDIIDIKARISWDSSDALFDSLKVYNTGKDSLVGTYAVKSNELAAGNKIIGGLSPKTEYKVEAYHGKSYKGKKIFKTVASENFSGTVVDLRNLDSEQAYKWLATSLDSIITQVYPDADITFVLNGGETYQLSNIILPATKGKLKFITGLSLAGNATFDVTGNFDVAADSQIGGISFEKIDFYGSQPSSTDNNYGSKYLFNLSANGSEVQSLDITNCNVKWKRGIVRIKGSAVIDTMNVDNCLMDSIAGYGLSNADNPKACIKVINVTNSTFSTVSLLCRGDKGLAPTSLVVENCSFANCGTLFQFNAKAPFTGDYKITNCLIGEYTGTLIAWKGLSPIAANLYFTSDLVWAPTSVDDATPLASLEGKVLSTSMVGTFKDWLNGDFTNISRDLGGDKPKPGDPRWY